MDLAAIRDILKYHNMLRSQGSWVLASDNEFFFFVVSSIFINFPEASFILCRHWLYVKVDIKLVNFEKKTQGSAFLIARQTCTFPYFMLSALSLFLAGNGIEATLTTNVNYISLRHDNSRGQSGFLWHMVAQ